MRLTLKNAVAGTLATLMVASPLASASAQAQDYRRDYPVERRDNTAAVAIGAGVIGLAIGAILASNNDRDRDRYDDRYDSRYDGRPVYGASWNRGWQYRDGWYWDGNGHRHSRDDYMRYQREAQRRGYDRDHGERRRGY